MFGPSLGYECVAIHAAPQCSCKPNRNLANQPRLAHQAGLSPRAKLPWSDKDVSFRSRAIMCLVSVKEDHDDYEVPARVVRRDRRRSPPRTTRVSRAYYEEQPRPTYVIQQPPQPPPVIAYAPPFEQHDHHDHHSHYDPPPPPPAPPSERHSHAGRSHAGTSHAGPQYVEVSPASRSSSSSSSSSSDGGRSKTTSRSRATGARSEYHMREKEYLHERRSPHGPPGHKDEYETYRYVQPPGNASRPRGSGNLDPRSSQIEDPRASRSSYNKREKIVVEDGFGGRTREYRR
ncbi:hypothetical protein D6D24_09953 [Aureobasidium pullulans]|uniref:Uncharacterized protein n=1 Tax=Aureobasidium pullulans TaxID=5580 RepID=A0A4S8V7K8_AURPU|nr:hypothetical protein D6D24_09953 [Aureobasidium pullulans]